MTLSTRPDHAAAPLPGLPQLIGHQFRYDLRRYWRNAQSVFSTIILPVMFLVIFASVYRNNLTRVPGGTAKFSVYVVPAIVAFGVLFAAFVNLVVPVVRNRESGIYKRRRAGRGLERPAHRGLGVVRPVLSVGGRRHPERRRVK